MNKMPLKEIVAGVSFMAHCRTMLCCQHLGGGIFEGCTAQSAAAAAFAAFQLSQGS